MSIMEFRDGKVTRETQYFGDPSAGGIARAMGRADTLEMFEQALTIAENRSVSFACARARRRIERELDIPPESIARRDELAAMRRAIPALERLAHYERRAWSSGRARHPSVHATDRS